MQSYVSMLELKCFFIAQRVASEDLCISYDLFRDWPFFPLISVSGFLPSGNYANVILYIRQFCP